MINVKGKTVVLTGTFSSLPCRTDMVARLRSLGATVKGSVDKNTDILFCGYRSGAKLIKARALRVTVYKTSGLRRALDLTAPKPHYIKKAGHWHRFKSVTYYREVIADILAGEHTGPVQVTTMPKNWRLTTQN